MDWIADNLSHLPVLWQIVLLVIITIMPTIGTIVAGIFGYLAKQQANKALDKQAELEESRNKEITAREDIERKSEADRIRLQAAIDSEKEQRAKAVEEMRNRHEKEMTEMRQEQKERDARAEISRTLMSLMKDQMSQTNKIAEQANQSNNKMIEAINKLGDRTVAAFEAVNEQSKVLEKSIKGLPILIADTVRDQLQDSINKGISVASSAHEQRAVERHSSIIEKLGSLDTRVSRLESPPISSEL